MTKKATKEYRLTYKDEKGIVKIVKFDAVSDKAACAKVAKLLVDVKYTAPYLTLESEALQEKFPVEIKK